MLTFWTQTGLFPARKIEAESLEAAHQRACRAYRRPKKKNIGRLMRTWDGAKDGTTATDAIVAVIDKDGARKVTMLPNAKHADRVAYLAGEIPTVATE